MFESVHEVEKTKISVRYVTVNNNVNILIGPLQIALSCLLLIEKKAECSKICSLGSENENFYELQILCQFSLVHCNFFWHRIKEHLHQF